MKQSGAGGGSSNSERVPHYTPQAPIPYFLTHPYSSPENIKSGPVFWKDGKDAWDGDGSNGTPDPLLTSRSAGDAEQGVRSLWSSPRRLGSAAMDDSHLLSYTRGGSERSTPLSLQSPSLAITSSGEEARGRSSHMRNNSQGVSGSHLSIIAKNPNGRAHRDMGHISTDEIALTSSAHQTAISGFNLYAPGCGHLSGGSRRKNTYYREGGRRSHGRGRSSRYEEEEEEDDYYEDDDDDYYYPDSDSPHGGRSSSGAPWMLGQPPPPRRRGQQQHASSCQARHHPIQAPMSTTRCGDTLSDQAHSSMASINSPHKTISTPLTTNTGHHTMVIASDVPPPPKGNRSQRRRPAPKSSSTTKDHLRYYSSGDDDDDMDGSGGDGDKHHHRITTFIKYADSGPQRASVPSSSQRRTWATPLSSVFGASSRPASGPPPPATSPTSQHTCRSSATTAYHARAVSDPWGGLTSSSSTRYGNSRRLGSASAASSYHHRRRKNSGGSFFDRLRAGSLNLLAQMGLFTPPAVPPAAAYYSTAGSVTDQQSVRGSVDGRSSSGGVSKNPKMKKEQRPSTTSSSSLAGSLLGGGRGGGGGRRRGRSGRPTGSHSSEQILKMLEEDDCPGSVVELLSQCLGRMIARLQLGEDAPEDRNEAARAERLTIALDGKDCKGILILHAVVAAKATKNCAPLADQATTVLNYMSTVRALRRQILRHMYNDRTLVEDVAALMMAHVAPSSSLIFVDCVEVMTSLLLDPVLREEALGIMPPNLIETVHRYRKQLNPGSSESATCTTFLRVVVRGV